MENNEMENNEIGFNINELRELIIKSLDLFDKKAFKYQKYIESEIKVSEFDIKIILYNREIKTDYEYIGYYDKSNNVWIWAWLLQVPNHKLKLAKELLYYGLKLDIPSINAEQVYLKSLLVNSRYVINDHIGLQINLAIFTYLLNEKILFIYPKKIDNMIIYYAIYNMDIDIDIE
jgi:hypothetical protein